MYNRRSKMFVQVFGLIVLNLAGISVPYVLAEHFGTPKENEGTRIFKATEHSHYSGQFHLSGQKGS
jgi:hypothetical protein